MKAYLTTALALAIVLLPPAVQSSQNADVRLSDLEITGQPVSPQPGFGLFLDADAMPVLDWTPARSINDLDIDRDPLAAGLV